jgi:hypothetical protein
VSVATAVGVSVGREGLVGGISVGGGRGVALETKGGVGACGEQEEMRTSKRKDTCTARHWRCKRTRVVMGWGMEGILTEIRGSLLAPWFQSWVYLLTKKPSMRFLWESHRYILSSAILTCMEALHSLSMANRYIKLALLKLSSASEVPDLAENVSFTQ